MSLDISEAFGEGLSRLATRPGAALAAAFVLVGLASAVLWQTVQVQGFEALLEFFRGASPAQLDMTQAEYQQQVSTLEDQVRTVRETSPLALEVPLSLAAAGLLLVAIAAEAVSIVAVRAFAADGADAVSLDGATEGLGLATLNGFVGGVVVWGLILVGSIFLLLPGLFAAVVFYFLRQEIALGDENFIDAMAGSWRLTNGQRLNVFALALLVVVVTQLGTVSGMVLGPVSRGGATLVSVVVGGILAAFGAAVVTQAYQQLRNAASGPPGDEGTTADHADPYDAALGPDDIPE